MAVTASGLYGTTFIDILDLTQLAIDFDAETHKGALFTNAITPNFDTDTAYGVAPYATNEVTSANWPAGGVALTGTVVLPTVLPGGLRFDANDVNVAATTLVNARCYLLYATPAPAGNRAIVLVNFGADYSTNNGALVITWDALGIFTIDLTP